MSSLSWVDVTNLSRALASNCNSKVVSLLCGSIGSRDDVVYVGTSRRFSHALLNGHRIIIKCTSIPLQLYNFQIYLIKFSECHSCAPVCHGGGHPTSGESSRRVGRPEVVPDLSAIRSARDSLVGQGRTQNNVVIPIGHLLSLASVPSCPGVVELTRRNRPVRMRRHSIV